jgi:UDP-N-acetylmuramoyl-L-alanyl-D-glutamate--2,6-diaminopimelate ligase
MTLGELLEGIPLRHELPSAAAALEVSGLSCDSRRVGKGFVFFAFVGARVDARRFAPQALEQGAVAVVCDDPAPADFPGVWIQAENSHHAVATAARNFYNKPDERIHFTGITGTNGKTTTSNLVDAILREAGHVTGVIGTIEYRLAGKVERADFTTPEAIDFMRFAAQLEKAGGDHLISEISSIGLAMGRVHGFHFHTAVFTNLTRDHLDFHGTLDQYADAKRLLFAPAEGPAPKWAVLNAEDPFTASVPRLGQTVLYGLGKDASLRAENLETGFDGVRFDLCWQDARQPIQSPLMGRINVMNILAAAGAGLSYGLDLPAIARGIAACRNVPGRFERVDCGQPFLVAVDYAHTDDALRNVIQIARELAGTGPARPTKPLGTAAVPPAPGSVVAAISSKSKGRVITLFGCGGDRDRSKRPLMGMAASELSDYVVLTSDNPRSEDPLAIINDALVGLRRFDTPHVAEPDRARAIRLAIEQAQPGDVVLLAGKGHETVQIFKDRAVHFDDRETAREVLKSFGYRK